MFTTVLKEITGYLDRRFILAVFLPSLILWTLGGGLWVNTHHLAQIIQMWSQQPTVIQGFYILLFLAWVTFFAFLLANCLTALTKLYEGYWEWIPWHEGITQRRKQRYQEELAYLDETSKVLAIRQEILKQQVEQLEIQLEIGPVGQDQEAVKRELDDSQAQLNRVTVESKSVYEEMYLYYPPPTRPDAVLPTRLGNILKSAELYPYLRYRIDAVLIWPRLYTLLPETFSKVLADSESSLDLMLVVSFLSYCVAIIGGGYLLLTQAAVSLFLLTFWGGLLVGWLGYRGALEAALAYGQLIKTAFDLHRGAVIKALGLKAPISLKEEQMLWDNIDKYLYRNFLENPAVYQYAANEPPKDGSS
jgi:hypothetical protein